MTLESLFYTLGIVFIFSWLFFLIALVVTGYLVFKKWKHFKTEVKKSSLATLGANLVKPGSLKTVIALWPIVSVGASFLKDRFKKRKK